MYTQTTTGNDSGYYHTENQNTTPNRAEEPVPARYEEVEQEVEKYKPTRAEMLTAFPITIEFLTIGCIVSVGCKRIPFTSISEGMKAINEYVEQPYEMRQKWEKLFEENK